VFLVTKGESPQMKRLAIVVTGVLLATGCSSNSSTTSPSSTNGVSNVRFTAALSPAQESPAIANAEAGGSGSVTIDMTVTRDAAGAITSAPVNFQVNLQGFPSTTVVNIAHIHT